MTLLGYACLFFAAAALAVQAVSIVLAMFRCRPRPLRRHAKLRPPVSIVRPLCGLEPYSRETISSCFAIDYPCYEILFCVADPADGILPLLGSILAEHKGRDARILIGDDAISGNPKLNNMAKGFRQSRFEHIVFVDSNVFTPPDYLGQLVARLEAGAGMVSSPPVGLAPAGFWAEVECAFLNSYQARMQYAVDMLGGGFAQGKTLFFRRADLEHGGFAQLGAEPAEDAAATRMMRARGRRIRLAGPFAQLIGPRSAAQMWKRQVRWARLRRASFPQFFALEVLAGPLPPLAALLGGLHSLGLAPALPVLAFALLWYGPELWLLRVARWPRSITAMLLRDLLLPALFCTGCAGSRIEWHGKEMAAAGRLKGARRPVMTPKMLWARLASRGPAE